MAMTIATIGRRMKKRDTSEPLGSRGCGLRLHNRVVLERGGVEDDAVSRLQPFLDDPAVANPLAEIDRADGRVVVGRQHADLMSTLKLRDRALRHEDNLLPDGGLRADAAILPGPKQVAGIRE